MARLLSAKSYAAHIEAGAKPETAVAAAEELGDVVGEARLLKWMSGVTIALVLVVIALLFQLALRLPVAR